MNINEHIAVMGNTSSGMSTPSNTKHKFVTKHKFECAPLLRLKQEKLVASNYFYKKALKTDLTKSYLDDVLYRCNHKDNNIISIYGETGSGKSLAAIATAYFITKTFNSKFYACFIADEVFDAIRKCKEDKDKGKHNVILLDEWVKQFGVGTGREFAQLGNIEETIRKRQIHLLYCAPEIFKHLHKTIVQMWDISETTDTSRGILEDKTEYPYGYILFSKPPSSLTDPYDIAKDAFLDKVQEMDFGKQENIDKWIDIIIKSDDWLHAVSAGAKKGVLIEVIKDLTPQLTTKEYEIIMSRIKLKQMKEEREVRRNEAQEKINNL